MFSDYYYYYYYLKEKQIFLLKKSKNGTFEILKKHGTMKKRAKLQCFYFSNEISPKEKF